MDCLDQETPFRHGGSRTKRMRLLVLVVEPRHRPSSHNDAAGHLTRSKPDTASCATSISSSLSSVSDRACVERCSSLTPCDSSKRAVVFEKAHVAMPSCRPASVHEPALTTATKQRRCNGDKSAGDCVMLERYATAGTCQTGRLQRQCAALEGNQVTQRHDTPSPDEVRHWRRLSLTLLMFAVSQ